MMRDDSRCFVCGEPWPQHNGLCQDCEALVEAAGSATVAGYAPSPRQSPALDRLPWWARGKAAGD